MLPTQAIGAFRHSFTAGTRFCFGRALNRYSTLLRHSHGRRFLFRIRCNFCRRVALHISLSYLSVRCKGLARFFISFQNKSIDNYFDRYWTGSALVARRRFYHKYKAGGLSPAFKVQVVFWTKLQMACFCKYNLWFFSNCFGRSVIIYKINDLPHFIKFCF